MGLIINDISNYYGIEKSVIENNLLKHELMYKKIDIEKKSGGLRTIYIPSVELKVYQKFILRNVLSNVSVSESATAYITGKSITSNCMPHLKNSYFLSIDLKDFFDSIDIGLLREKLQKYAGLPDDNDYFFDFWRICSLRNKIVQGNVTSPILSNIFMIDIDAEIRSYVTSNITNGVYTRYSDDITISSSDFIDNQVINYVKRIFKKNKLKINYKKIRFSTKNGKIHMTGIGLKENNDVLRMSLSTSLKKTLKGKIYKCLNGDKTYSLNHIMGYLYYIKMIEPDYFNMLNMKYSDEGLTLVERLKLMDEK